ncbi:MAG: PqqD family protein [Planctomycetota bacterium]|jgi:hypothetical protein
MFYSRKEEVSHRFIANEAVIVNLKSGEMTVLNESGSAVWAELDGQKDIAQLTDSIKSKYSGAVVPDLADFIEDLYSKKLLVKSENPLQAEATEVNQISETDFKELPAVISFEKLETLAGICGSSYTGEIAADCRTSGLGCWDIAT